MQSAMDIPQLGLDGSGAGAVSLRDLVYSDQLTFLMEAHDALSAAVAERAGFKALWASGLTIWIQGCQRGIMDGGRRYRRAHGPRDNGANPRRW
jgi:hypothetical protein